MNQEIKNRWVAWLRANVDKQGFGSLTRGDTFCCLGGLCELAVAAGVVTRDGTFYGNADSTLPTVVSEWAGLMNESCPDNPVVRVRTREGLEVEETLAEVNDAWDEYDFNKIADVIDAQL